MTVEKITLLNVTNSKKYCHKRIGIGIVNTFQQQYWYLGIGNTLCQSTVTVKYCYWY